MDSSAQPSDEPPVILPIEDSLDLHAFAPRDIPDVVRDYLEACVAQHYREVRVIHGRGIGFQRQVVRAVLEAHPSVLGFADAPAGRGGWGATVVQLKTDE